MILAHASHTARCPHGTKQIAILASMQILHTSSSSSFGSAALVDEDEEDVVGPSAELDDEDEDEALVSVRSRFSPVDVVAAASSSLVKSCFPNEVSTPALLTLTVLNFGKPIRIKFSDFSHTK